MEQLVLQLTKLKTLWVRKINLVRQIFKTTNFGLTDFLHSGDLLVRIKFIPECILKENKVTSLNQKLEYVRPVKKLDLLGVN